MPNTFEIWIQEGNKVTRKRKYSGTYAEEMAVESGFTMAKHHSVAYLRKVVNKEYAKVQKIEYIGSGQCSVSIARGEH